MSVACWAGDAVINFSPLQYDKLPDMQTARRGHSCFVTAEGDVVVAGGHTTGFGLTATAERLHDGVWESINISNAHDGGATIILPDGRTLICGGMGSGAGVGQSTVCEIYDPTTNTFSSVADLNTKRAFCHGVATGEGNNVLLAGNWYAAGTAVELWNGTSWSSFGQMDWTPNQPLLTTDGQGTVFLFAVWDNYAVKHSTAVYRIDTKQQTLEKVEDSGLENYELVHGDYQRPGTFTDADGNFYCLGIKDEATHLLQFNPTTGKGTQVATLPTSIPDVTSKLRFWNVLGNKERGEVYVVGNYQHADGFGLAILNFQLATGEMSVFYDSKMSICFHYGSWTLQPATGRLVVTGGSTTDDGQTNYNSSASAISIIPYATAPAGISETLYTPTGGNSSWHTLDGRRLTTVPQQKGIYINSGRKVISR